MKLKTKLWLLTLFIGVITISNCSHTAYKQSVELYNNSVGFETDYSRQTQKQVSVYDANYLAFIQKSNIANINKETFIVVTDIIMSNRRDGQSVAWKWVHENQQIPYNEFTDFYRDLSQFVEQQYATYSAIEQEKQNIVAKQNSLIRTYPNNIYNLYLKIRPLKYSFGFVSDSTKALFRLK